MVARPRFEPAQTTYCDPPADSAMVTLLLTSQPPPRGSLDKYPEHFKEGQYEGQQ